MPYKESTAKLQDLIHRKGQVTVMMHPFGYAMARVMEAAGCEGGMCGTGGEWGALTGMQDDGSATITECVMLAGWTARGVKMPVLVDGDTGHGGIMAVRRLVKESIEAGLAGIRIDDQDIEGKRATGTGGVSVAPIDIVLARYKAAVDMKNEMDPNFVIMAQCYAGESLNGGFDEAIERMKLYEQEAGVDWVQFVSPRTEADVRNARAAVKGPFSIMEHFLPKRPSHQDLLDWGITLQWGANGEHFVPYAAMYDFVKDFLQNGPAATENWRKANAGNPIADGTFKPRVISTQQRELELKYFPDGANRYESTAGFQGSRDSASLH